MKNMPVRCKQESWVIRYCVLFNYRPITAVVIIAVLLTSFASTSIAQNKKVTMKKLQGKWVPSSMEIGGNKLPKDQLKKFSLEIIESNYVVTTSQAIDKGKLKIETDVNKEEPEMKMDIIGVEGPNKGKTFPAIFKFVDSGELHICYNLGGKDRPKEFKSPKNELILLSVYKKADLQK